MRHWEGAGFLIYPIVYLYRHHIELALKSLISLSGSLLDRLLGETDQKTIGRHDLADLWKLKTAAQPGL